jgi:hypothetical protein
MFYRKFLDKGVIMTSNSEPELEKSLFFWDIVFCRAKTQHTNDDDDSLEDDEELDDEDDDFDDFEDDEEFEDEDNDFDDDDN